MARLVHRLLLTVLTAVLQCGHTSTWTLPISDCQDDACPGIQMLQSQVRSIVHNDVSRRTAAKLQERTDKRERLQFANEVEFNRAGDGLEHAAPTSLGDSVRLGNFICSWTSLQIPGYKFRDEVGFPTLSEEQGGFGKFLANQSTPIVLLPDELAVINDDHSEWESPGAWRHTWTYWRLLSRKPWPWRIVYEINQLKVIANPMGSALASHMRSYAKSFAPWLTTQSTPRHCVVHYRVGDVVSYWDETFHDKEARIISPQSIAAQVTSFSPQPLTVEILGGGAVNHNLDSNHTRARDELKSLELLAELQQSIRRKLPGVEVALALNGTSDEDWFKLANAPNVVIGVGSFALTAAAAGLSNQVRSPATSSFPPTTSSQVSPTEIRPGWTTFEYELRKW